MSFIFSFLQIGNEDRAQFGNWAGGRDVDILRPPRPDRERQGLPRTVICTEVRNMLSIGLVNFESRIMSQFGYVYPYELQKVK